MANYALAADAVVDFPTAYTFAPLFDATGWNAEVCAQHGATAGQLPRVDAPGAAAGHVGDAVLAVGAIDALCEQMVSGADDVGDVLVLCGTTLIVWVTVPEPRQVPGLWTIPTMTGKSQIGGASNAGGLFLGWVDRVVAPGDPDAADPRRVPVWSPYLRGERTPFHDPDRRGMLDGLDLGHDASALRRAAYEASGFVVRHLIELSGAPVSRIVAAGGGTRVQAWMQAIADATGRPVQLSGVAEGAALGAAFLGRMAVGKESAITDAARWASIERAVEPRRRGWSRWRNAIAGSWNWRRYGSSAETYLMSPNATIDEGVRELKAVGCVQLWCGVHGGPPAWPARYSTASLRSPSYTSSDQFRFNPRRRQRSLISLPRLAIRSRMSGT